MENKAIPLINMRDYLERLSDYVSTGERYNFSLIVVGPKSSGKSKGIQEMAIKWEEQGHFVLDINSKGKPHNITASQVLGAAAMKVYVQVSEAVVFSCFHDHVCNECLEVLPQTYTWLIRLQDNSIYKIVSSVVAAIIANATLIGLCRWCIQQASAFWCNVLLVLVAAVFSLV